MGRLFEASTSAEPLKLLHSQLALLTASVNSLISCLGVSVPYCPESGRGVETAAPAQWHQAYATNEGCMSATATPFAEPPGLAATDFGPVAVAQHSGEHPVSTDIFDHDFIDLQPEADDGDHSCADVHAFDDFWSSLAKSLKHPELMSAMSAAFDHIDTSAAFEPAPADNTSGVLGCPILPVKVPKSNELNPELSTDERPSERTRSQCLQPVAGEETISALEIHQGFDAILANMQKLPRFAHAPPHRVEMVIRMFKNRYPLDDGQTYREATALEHCKQFSQMLANLCR